MGDGFFSKLKVLIGIEEIEDEDFEEEEEVSGLERKTVETRSSFNTMKKDINEVKDNKDSRVLPLTAKTVSNSQFKMLVIEPKSFDECPRLVDSLKAKKPVIINLEKIESDIARKIFDFLSGATYALNGNVQKIANNIFVFAPENVDVTANIDSKNTVYVEDIKNPWR
jgi:cell division inhibitor SepF